MQKKNFFVVLCLMCAMLFLAATGVGFAQDINASLSGTVTDPSGAAIPNAQLVLTNDATGAKSTFISNGAGEFNFTNLVPGRYSMAVTAAGFQNQL